ncbi:peptidase [Streptococcus pacificus]|uniref:Peptidase n=1 Tax=Streptococcus pacificus TaxID=2740577 RepID=A0ABS0ZGJ2_9STRE|nr:peptidase [Streptococcus pacificus]MBJ8325130.1 peptidase [Streptococcus pacificus]
MKTSKSELVYLILSIIVIAFAGFIYVVFGKTHSVASTNNSKTVQVETSTETTTTEVNKDDELIAIAQSRITNYQQNPTDDTRNTAQIAIDMINDDTKKQELQTSIDAITNELNNQANAETALVNAEGYQVQSNVDIAQNAINALTDPTKKAELQARLDIVIANINAYNQSLNTPAATEQ